MIKKLLFSILAVSFAAAGLGSRRHCERLITAGRVHVDGVVVSELGARVDPRRAVVLVDGMRINTRDDMVYLALNKPHGYATLLLDVAPGTRFPSHHHGGAEECYVVSGSLFTCGRRLGPGDFVHADADTDHGELWTEEGCQVILVVPPEEHLPPSMLG